MLILVYEFFAVIATAILSIVLLIGCVYYILTIISIIFGLMGAYSISLWFSRKADAFSDNIKNTYNIVTRKRK